MKHSAGIYCIESPSGAIYIGQSVNIEKRLRSYKSLCCKDQPAIFNSLKKYGVDKHSFKIVAHFTNDVPKDVLDFYEIEYMELFRSNGFRMLNIKDGGSNGRMAEETKNKLSEQRKGVKREYFKGELNPFFGKKHDSETRAKMSASNKGNRVGVKNGRARSIYQFDLNLNLIKEHQTVTFAAKDLNISRQGISDVLNGRNKTSAGYIWKYKEMQNV